MISGGRVSKLPAPATSGSRWLLLWTMRSPHGSPGQRPKTACPQRRWIPTRLPLPSEAVLPARLTDVIKANAAFLSS